MDYTKKIIKQSKDWYNDGLKKAQIRDLSGAIVSLRKSLQFDKGNIEARNLLGLVYYGRGEVAEALVEWILSKNLKKKDNPANRYLRNVQEAPKALEKVDQAVKKYNQSLSYCEQQNFDLAIIQLKKAVTEHPTFLKAYQLLALLYMYTGQDAKAKQMLREAKKLDTTNETTLRYIHELNQEYAKQSKKEGKKEHTKQTAKQNAVEYNLGNETIIQPVHSAVKEVAAKSAILYMLVGILIGAAVVWFLAAPASKATLNEKHNKELLKYSERINTQEAQISALTRTLDQYRAAAETDESQTASGTADSYEALLEASTDYASGEYSEDTILELLYNVTRSALGSGGQMTYDSLLEAVSYEGCELEYQSGVEAVEVGNYESAIHALEIVIWQDESYADGDALLNLGLAYLRSGDKDKATSYLAKVKELFPDSEVEEEANIYLQEIADMDTEADTADTIE